MMELFILFFFFKQKTAYEMCGRDWSSDVCSSDLTLPFLSLPPLLSPFPPLSFSYLPLSLSLPLPPPLSLSISPIPSPSSPASLTLPLAHLSCYSVISQIFFFLSYAIQH